MISSVLIAIIVIALFFEFTNGFHDAANVVATPIATKSLTPYQAIALAAFFNFLGAFFGTAVAATISKGLIDTNVVTDIVAANVVATPIATKSLTPYQAIALAAFFNFLGAFFGTAVAATIS
ncbi:inorganic phosphate transporter, partial [Francisella tularensis]|uniref:inorganic phosphate transporter n=1 Tax=Francisella tularensis TaxID=263 RepID=UPI001F48BAAB